MIYSILKFEYDNYDGRYVKIAIFAFFNPCQNISTTNFKIRHALVL